MSKQNNKQQIFVYAHWSGIKNPNLMGILYSERLKGKELFSFEYDADWLKSKHAQLLDPNLKLYSGLHYLNSGQENFGLFLDSAPDRWGRILMRRREAALARLENRQEKKLFEIDYLLGVFDGHRMGGVRFKRLKNGPFLNDNIDLACPPWASIRALEQISLKLESQDVSKDPAYLKWLNLLVAPGSSLGGARPKASIVNTDGSLWIAKFPSINDQGDIGGWEIVCYELALKAGVKMADSVALKFSSNHHTFLTKRFDRNLIGERIHFASAMTLLGYNDGQNYQDGASYLELAAFISNNGANVKCDLEELWRRIVFNICVSNTDDHLRNHGFILSDKGWLLSPAYDINPTTFDTGLSLNITENDNALDLNLALKVHEYFRLNLKNALKIIDEVKSAVKNWKNIANKYQLSYAEQELKKQAFINSIN